MDPLVTEFRRTKSAALEALRSGESNRARQLLLMLSRTLFRMAERAPAGEGLQRSREAREMQLAADAVVSEPGSEATPGSEDGRVVTGPSIDEAAPERSFVAKERPTVRLHDVAGLDAVKEEFRLKLIYPFQHPREAARYRLRRGGGILLFGPPGTGKTLLARAVAGEMDAAFFAVKPSEILSKWVGEAEKNMEELFREARSHEVAVIFVDEVEALAPRRSEHSSSVMARLVPQILAEMEGFQSQDGGALLFLGATNEPWLLDPAILRPGRFDEKIHIGLPDREALAKLLEIHLAGRPLAPELDLDGLAGRLSGFSGADVRRVCDRAAAESFVQAIRTGTERSITEDQLSRWIRATTPSVSSALAARYANYARGLDGRSARAGDGAQEALPLEEASL